MEGGERVMDIRIKYDESLQIYVAIIDGELMMKNKKQSMLMKKLYRWLLSQGM